MNLTKLSHLASFIGVVEANGFAAAARTLGISTAAISRQVAELEAALQVQLLKRTTRQVQLTEVGAEYYQQAKLALTGLAEAESAIQQSQSQAAGSLRIVSNRYYAMRYLVPRLPQFMALHPELAIHLELAECFPDFNQENIDVIFGVSLDGPEHLVRRRIASARYVLCASPTYLAQHGVPKTPADLMQHRYITHSMRNPDHVVTLKKHAPVCVKPSLWLNDSRAMCSCAINGLGVVKLHDYVVKEALDKGALVEILPDFAEDQQAVYLYYQSKRYLQPKIRRFIDFYVEE